MAKFYLAYGSNLSVGQMLHRCPNAVYVGRADLEGTRLMFRGSRTGSYLTVEPAEGRSVPCLVWKVTETDEANLDLYEGFPRFYRKETVQVAVRNLADGKRIGSVEAFVYVMNEGRGAGKPSTSYFSTCLEGYRRFGFDEMILARAYDESVERAYDD